MRLLRSDGWYPAEPAELDPVGYYSDNARGIGPAEMADAIENGRTNRTDKYMAVHVLQVIEAMEQSAAEKRMIEITSSFEQPALFTDHLG